ncbi:MAG: dodecin family protein [Xanthomonadales bacterium]|nr:dodecin family protein [Xanthomonadales bacterium]
MSNQIAKVIELFSSSTTSIEDAVERGLAKASETVKGIQGAWVNDIKVTTDSAGKIAEWRVSLKVTFIVD